MPLDREAVNGDCLGTQKGKTIAMKPLEGGPWKTRIAEPKGKGVSALARR